MSSPQLHRSKMDRRIAGVCGGLAEHFNIDPLLVRILFFVFALCATAGLWIYLLLWLLVPEE
jgi:phage shock protein C